MDTMMHGIVHGKTIELSESTGMPDGTAVQISVKAISPTTAAWGEGRPRCARALADEWTEEDDRFLEEIHQERSPVGLLARPRTAEKAESAYHGENLTEFTDGGSCFSTKRQSAPG